MVVYFIGGITYKEINALRRIRRDAKSKFSREFEIYIVSSDITNSKRFISELIN